MTTDTKFNTEELRRRAAEAAARLAEAEQAEKAIKTTWSDHLRDFRDLQTRLNNAASIVAATEAGIANKKGILRAGLGSTHFDGSDHVANMAIEIAALPVLREILEGIGRDYRAKFREVIDYANEHNLTVSDEIKAAGDSLPAEKPDDSDEHDPTIYPPNERPQRKPKTK